MGWFLSNSKRRCPEYGDAFEKSRGSQEEVLAQDSQSGIQWERLGRVRK